MKHKITDEQIKELRQKIELKEFNKQFKPKENANKIKELQRN